MDRCMVHRAYDEILTMMKYGDPSLLRDPRLIRIYWRFQYLRDRIVEGLSETVVSRKLCWELEDRWLAFHIGEGNVPHMNGHQPLPSINPTPRETKEAMVWLIDGTYTVNSVSYFPPPDIPVTVVD